MTVTQSSSGPSGGVVTELWRRNRVLCTVAAINLVLAVLFTALMQLDGRTLLGRNVWTKPWKFAVSISIYTATVGWILPSLCLGDRVERLVTAIVGTTLLLEITLISTQAARGVQSHFNTSTPLDAGIFAVMGIAITVNTLAMTYVLWRLFRSPPDLDPAYLWGLRVGLLVFVLASFQGGYIAARGTHSVGVAADSAGLPLLNWKLSGGDLRIAHFAGLHALQVLPLAGYVLATRQALSRVRSLSVLGVVTVIYSSLTVGTLVQALLGDPLLSALPAVSMTGVFSASVLLVAPFWTLMILAPSWDVTERVVDSHLPAVPAALLHVGLLVPVAPTVAATVLDPSLSGVTRLFATEVGATIAWVHFLAFDLFVGQWVYRDARQRGVPTLVTAPTLLLTLLFGPAGFVCYVAVRHVTSTEA